MSIRLSNNTSVQLNAVQTYLLQLYLHKYHLKVDLTFQQNFWKTIKIPNVGTDRDVHLLDRLKISKATFDKSVEQTENLPVIVDNVSHKITGCIEGPSIFCGRDACHPLRGTCKHGVSPNEVTLNMSANANRKRAMERGFSKFIENKDVNWIASWKDSVTEEARYIGIKRSCDHMLSKFDNARNVHKQIKKIHKRIATDIVSDSSKQKQLALAVYIIEHLCIRVGNEKDVLHEADTIGCCTLRAHTHISTRKLEQRRVLLTFLGKDSVPFHKEFILPAPFFNVYNNLLLSKKPNELFFDLLNPCIINRYLNNIVPNCTARTFRTIKASVLFESSLLTSDDPRHANGQVAKALNHKRGNEKVDLNLETSRKNYIDPRIYIAYCKRSGVSPKSSWLSIEDRKVRQMWHQTDPSFRFRV